MIQNTDNQLFTEDEHEFIENKYELHIFKYVSKGWQTIRKSTVDFVGLGFLFVIILFAFGWAILVPLSEFILRQIEFRSSYQLLGTFVLISTLFLLALFLLSRYYFYFAKSISNENAEPFSFQSLLSDCSQLCMELLCFPYFGSILHLYFLLLIKEQNTIHLF